MNTKLKKLYGTELSVPKQKLVEQAFTVNAKQPIWLRRSEFTLLDRKKQENFRKLLQAPYKDFLPHIRVKFRVPTNWHRVFGSLFKKRLTTKEAQYVLDNYEILPTAKVSSDGQTTIDIVFRDIAIPFREFKKDYVHSLGTIIVSISAWRGNDITMRIQHATNVNYQNRAWHPHIADDIPCLGTWEKKLQEAYDNMEVDKLIFVIRQFLQHYSSQNPYWRYDKIIANYREIYKVCNPPRFVPKLFQTGFKELIHYVIINDYTRGYDAVNPFKMQLFYKIKLLFPNCTDNDILVHLRSLIRASKQFLTDIDERTSITNKIKGRIPKNYTRFYEFNKHLLKIIKIIADMVSRLSQSYLDEIKRREGRGESAYNPNSAVNVILRYGVKNIKALASQEGIIILALCNLNLETLKEVIILGKKQQKEAEQKLIRKMFIKNVNVLKQYITSLITINQLNTVSEDAIRAHTDAWLTENQERMRNFLIYEGGRKNEINNSVTELRKNTLLLTEI